MTTRNESKWRRLMYELKALDKGEWVVVAVLLVCLLIMGVIGYLCYIDADPIRRMPKIIIASMNFTITEIPINLKWDLLIRTPQNLLGNYICLEGDLQTFLIYKHVTVATSPPQRYNILQPHWPHLLRVSVVASENDINNVVIGKNILDDIIKEKGHEVRFGSRLVFPDCSEKTTGTISFTCDEAALRFDSSSHTMTMTTSKNPTCLYDDPSPDSFYKRIMEYLMYYNW